MQVGDKGSLNFSGSSGSSDGFQSAFEELYPMFSMDFDLHTWSDDPLGDVDPSDIVTVHGAGKSF